MKKLKSELLTQQILEILGEIQKLKRQHKSFEDFDTMEIHLKNGCTLMHKLTLEIKNEEK